jgi:uncharacterized protein involved in outer membrane biogenesis
MLLPSKPPRPRRSRLRSALRGARDTYRQYSGAASREPRGPALATRRPGGRPAETPARRDDPDVLLDVPRLHVDEIDLRLDDLKARVALEAHVLDLLRLDVGIDAELHGVNLQVKGVDAQALLKVRLEHLTTILDRVMTTVDRNPQILERVTHRLETALDQLGSGAIHAASNLGENPARR